MLYSCAWSQHAQSKASGSPAKHSYCHPVNHHWDSCAPLRHLSLLQANSPGAELITCRRAIHPGVMERSRGTLEVPQQPLSKTRTVSICFPSLHQVPIGITSGWAASLVNTWHTQTHKHYSLYTHIHTCT